MNVIENDSVKRAKFVDTFIDKENEYYNSNIANPIQEQCYSGYLWEVFINKEVKDEACLVNYIQALDKVNVIWDNNLFVREYARFPKNSLIEMSGNEFLEIIPTFPEDIYVFDDTYSWAISFTHESNLDNSRFCLFSKSRRA
jgi:hypothetical protein